MNIKTKFNIGDTVYVIHKDTELIEIECDLCNGNGFVHIKENDDEIKCPNCYGTGKAHISTPMYHKDAYKVSLIFACINKDEKSISYDLVSEKDDLDRLCVDQSFLFTEKEADTILKGTPDDSIVAPKESNQFIYLSDAAVSTQANSGLTTVTQADVTTEHTNDKRKPLF